MYFEPACDGLQDTLLTRCRAVARSIPRVPIVRPQLPARSTAPMHTHTRTHPWPAQHMDRGTIIYSGAIQDSMPVFSAVASTLGISHERYFSSL